MDARTLRRTIVALDNIRMFSIPVNLENPEFD